MISNISLLIIYYYLIIKDFNINNKMLKYLTNELDYMIYTHFKETFWDEYDIDTFSFSLPFINKIVYNITDDINYKNIVDNIYEYIHINNNHINNNDIIISINIVPFHGIDLTHSDIINILNLYFT